MGNLVLICAKIIIYLYNNIHYKLYLVSYFYDYCEDNSENTTKSELVNNVIYNRKLAEFNDLNKLTSCENPKIENEYIKNIELCNLPSNKSSDFESQEILNTKKIKNRKNICTIISEKETISHEMIFHNKSEIDSESESKLNKPLQLIIEKMHHKQKENLSLSFRQIIHYICFNKSKRKFINKCYQIIKNHLSIETLISSTRYFKKINYFQLNDLEKIAVANIKSQNNLIMCNQEQNLSKEDKYLKRLYEYVDEDKYNISNLKYDNVLMTNTIDLNIEDQKLISKNILECYKIKE